MQLIEIDVVGAESAQAVVAGLPDVLRPRPFALVVHRHAELRRDDRPIASVGECAPEELLALGRAVDVGGVEEVDARIERGVDDALGGGGVDAHPEVVAAEADDRDAQRSDRTMLHPDRIRLRIDLAQERAQQLIELVGLFHHQEVRRAGDLVILDLREDARDCLT